MTDAAVFAEMDRRYPLSDKEVLVVRKTLELARCGRSRKVDHLATALPEAIEYIEQLVALPVKVDELDRLDDAHGRLHDEVQRLHARIERLERAMRDIDQTLTTGGVDGWVPDHPFRLARDRARALGKVGGQ